MSELLAKRKIFDAMLIIVSENLKVNGYQSLQVSLMSACHELFKEIESPSEFKLKRSELMMTIRSCNCLSSVGVFTEKDLLAWNPNSIDLRKIPGIGTKSLKEIREYIYSLKLGKGDKK